jgi:hypothetical protein
MKYNKYLIFSAFLIIFIFLNAGFTLAALEVTYPSIPGLPDINQNNPGISEFVGYFFGLGIYIAGILSLISFTIGAIGIIGASAVGDPSKRSDSMDRIKGALLGLVLTAASFIIIRTINPVLITPSLTPLPGVQGVFYINGSGQRKPVGIEVSDVQNRGEDLITGGFDSIIYDCKDATLAPTLLLWEFGNADLEFGDATLTNVQVKRINCQETETIADLGSFRMEFETPGVYYCLGGCSGNICSGYMSGANTSSQDSISEPFKGEMGGVRIVNDAGKGLYYGVIFHNQVGLKNGGLCTLPIVNTANENQCVDINNISVSSADIFVVNNSSNSSGDGVTFYSEPYGWSTGASAGFENIPDDVINAPFLAGDAKKMCFDYKNIDRPDVYKYKCINSACGAQDNACNDSSECNEGEMCDVFTYTCVGDTGEMFCSDNACETFQDCPGSINIKGSYLVALYSQISQENNASAYYCQTFKKSVENLNTEQFIASGGNLLNGVSIIPIK